MYSKVFYFYYYYGHIFNKLFAGKGRKLKSVLCFELLSVVRRLIDEFLACNSSGVARCNPRISLESLSFFSITVLRMF